MREDNRIWWERVPTAVQNVKKAGDFLQSWKSVAVASNRIEWGLHFMEAVKESIESENFVVSINRLDLSDLVASESIVDRIADDLQIGYMSQRKIKELMPELPQDGSIWLLTGLKENRLKELHSLIQECRENNAKIAFIYNEAGYGKVKGCERIDITPNALDMQYYAWTLLLGKYPNVLLEYASRLAVEVSGEEPERCAELCEKFIQAPRNLHEIVINENASMASVQIHTAQVRVIEPLIEYGRIWLIRQIGENTRRILPFKDEYGTEFTKPEEIELRNLVYYRNELMLNATQKEILQLLYDARNKISHLEILPIAELEAILTESIKWN